MKLKSLLTESTKLKFPIYVEGSYRGRGCDEFHAFNDTHGRTVGGMNIKVNKKLKEIYNAGYNPDITNVEIHMDNSNYFVSWKVTINESRDGKAWVGLVSRGAGSGSETDVIHRADPSNSSNHTSPSTILNRYSNIEDIKQVLDYKYLPKTGCKVRQIFYKYTQKNYPVRQESYNKKIRAIIGTVYYIINNPEKYFSKFKSWNPAQIKQDPNIRFVSGDDELAASSWFASYVNKNILPTLRNIYPHCEKHDKINIQNIYSLLKMFNNAIKNDKEVSINFVYYIHENIEWNIKNLTFTWNGL